MIMMNCFYGMGDQRKAFSLISSRHHCQSSSPSRISDTTRAAFQDFEKNVLGYTTVFRPVYTIDQLISFLAVDYNTF